MGYIDVDWDYTALMHVSLISSVVSLLKLSLNVPHHQPYANYAQESS